VMDIGITQFKTCTVKSPIDNGINKHFFTLSTISVFVIPMAIISILYILIGLQLRRSQILNRNSVYINNDQLKPRKFKRSFETNISMEYPAPILIQYCPAKRGAQHCCTKASKSNINNNFVRTLKNGSIQYVSTVPLNAGARRVVKMLVIVVVTFFICWAPHHAQRLLAVYGNNGHRSSDEFNYIFDCLTYASGVLYFTSTCINPFLYSIMSFKFREAFK
ncbi:Pyrokinin-1 receptor, partial [Pseudolycoriella hygida]